MLIREQITKQLAEAIKTEANNNADYHKFVEAAKENNQKLDKLTSLLETNLPIYERMIDIKEVCEITGMGQHLLKMKLIKAD